MRLLLDTHLFLWWINGDSKLPKEAKTKISNAEEVYISSASIWEAVIKIPLKKLKAEPKELVAAITKSGFIELPVNSQHALVLSSLPDFHRDPCDRILIAQALAEPLILITADAQLKPYSDLVETC